MKKEGTVFSRRGFIKSSLTAASSVVLFKTSPTLPLADASAAENPSAPPTNLAISPPRNGLSFRPQWNA